MSSRFSAQGNSQVQVRVELYSLVEMDVRLNKIALRTIRSSIYFMLTLTLRGVFRFPLTIMFATSSLSRQCQTASDIIMDRLLYDPLRRCRVELEEDRQM